MCAEPDQAADAEAQKVAPDRAPLRAGEIFTDAVGGELVMPPALDFFIRGAGENLDEVVHADAETSTLPHAVNAGEQFLRLGGGVVIFAWLEAVVARAAIWLRVGLGEVVQKLPASAGGAVRISHHKPQLLAGDPLFVAVAHFIDEVRLLRGIARAEEQEAVAGESIAAGTTGFLIVALDIFRQVVVNDPAHIGFVDAHAEGDGSADDARLVADEEFLVLRPLVVGEACVIWHGGESALREALCHTVRRGPRSAIDDAAIHRSRFDEVQNLLRRLLLGNDAIGEVRTVEARHKNLRLAKAQVLDDVIPHALGGRRRECHEWNVGKPLPKPGDLAILGAEIMAPLGYAVGLVNGDRGDVPSAEIFLPVVEHEALRRCVEELVAALVQPCEARFRFLHAKRGIQKCRLHTRSLQLVHLILHQSNQRRNNERQTLPQQRRQLEAQRLAAACGQQRKRVPPGEVCLHDLALKWAKSIVAECGFECFLKFIHARQGPEDSAREPDESSAIFKIQDKESPTVTK